MIYIYIYIFFFFFLMADAEILGVADDQYKADMQCWGSYSKKVISY